MLLQWCRIKKKKMQLTLNCSTLMKFDRSSKFDLAMLLWASKFTMAKIECDFEMGK